MYCRSQGVAKLCPPAHRLIDCAATTTFASSVLLRSCRGSSAPRLSASKAAAKVVPSTSDFEGPQLDCQHHEPESLESAIVSPALLHLAARGGGSGDRSRLADQAAAGGRRQPLARGRLRRLAAEARRQPERVRQRHCLERRLQQLRRRRLRQRPTLFATTCMTDLPEVPATARDRRRYAPTSTLAFSTAAARQQQRAAVALTSTPSF